MYQKRNEKIYNPDEIFGKFDPRAMDLNLKSIFGPVTNPKKELRFRRRGESALWNDADEFITPVP